MKKIIALVSVIAMLMSTTVDISAISSVDKIYGKNIHETSAAVAKKRGYSSAVIVNMDYSVADGLSAAALAGKTNGVILTVSRNSIPSGTMESLNGVKNVYIIGLEEAVSKSVEDKIKSKGIKTKRIGGKDRYETSLNVAEEVKEMSGNNLSEVMYANGKIGEADVVTASSVAYKNNTPILLTNGKTIIPKMKQLSNRAGRRYLIGGTAVISSSIASEIGNAERIGGKDRFVTNQMIVDKFYYTKPTAYHIVDYQDYKTAIVASSISYTEPIALVADNNNKATVIKGAKKLTAVGNVSQKLISRAIYICNGSNEQNSNNQNSKFDYSWTKNKYIAHAMGGIDGKTYTNSYEAMVKSYQDGFKVFEVDLIEDKIGGLMACHSFSEKDMIKMGMPTSYATNRPTAAEFKKQKIYGKYTTMTIDDILDYMRTHKDMYLVVDMKDKTTSGLRRNYNIVIDKARREGVLDRIIPQAYSTETFELLDSMYEFKSMILTCYSMEDVNSYYIADYCKRKGIGVLTVDGKKYSSNLLSECKKKGIKMYMNTYNDQSTVNRYTGYGVSGFYTDFLRP